MVYNHVEDVKKESRKEVIMNYIVLDLEWNQSNTGLEPEVSRLPFEIIEIGAIKLNSDLTMISEFSELIKPVVYHELHHITSKIIHMKMEELMRGDPFPRVLKRFLEWCGSEENMFCIWGTQDLTELQKNIKFHKQMPLSEGPIKYLDVQKLYGLAYGDGKTRKSLETAVDELQIVKDIPFHRAFSDAYYTAKVMEALKDKNVFHMVSYDTYQPPKCREEEIKVQFDTYFKYISREFSSKAEAFLDKEVVSSKCYLCHKNLRKKIRWFTPNGRNYYCVAFCDKHGYLKGKIRVRKTDEGKIYVVKTTKFVDEAQMDAIVEKKERAAQMRKLKKKKTKR